MGTKVSKVSIGAFVLGAVVLLVAAVLVFGAGKFFTKQNTYLTYFEGSVKGLNVGSPVTFRGVKVGSVSDISIIMDESTKALKIPVVFVIDPAKFKGTRAEFQRGDPSSIKRAVTTYGLRTQLQSMSFVTGQLMVALDFFPSKPARFVGLIKTYPEIPSVPTPLEELQKTVQDLPLREIVENLNRAIAGVDRVISSVNVEKTTKNIDVALQDIQGLVRNLNGRVGPLTESLAKTSEEAQATLKETQETAVVVRGGIKELAASTQKTLEAAQTALKQSEHTLRSYSDDSEMMAQMDRTMRDLSAMTRSFRQLSDYLERHPEALIRGKGSEGGRDGR
ncbi:MlaD family protein [Geomonas sp. RF6]|uniref:MlaD family protein n=1 Tax=Geomonas sp. RF6 TaxID=2897342 RepID=UPI001E57633D|nr:MlaD family protein [Geomonas sp. RF6]UFS70650.1 MlaD family protein [Geomonas sp. RF6]